MYTTSNLAVDESENEAELFSQLDKGIEDLKSGKITPHEETIKLLKESVDNYAL